MRLSLLRLGVRSNTQVRRVFQALRIQINGELNSLSDLLKVLPEHFNEDGRVVFLSFHSLEDRLIKQSFKTWQNPCTCPSDFPICACGKKPRGFIERKGELPSPSEVSSNPRARSARIRSFCFTESKLCSRIER